MTRSNPSSVVKRSVRNSKKVQRTTKSDLKFIQGTLAAVQLLFDDDGILIKIPNYWFSSISKSSLYDTLKLGSKEFFYDRDIDTEEVEAFISQQGLNLCFLKNYLSVNIELLWNYKEMLSCLYQITILNKIGAPLEEMLSKFKEHLVAYVVESIECSVGYDIDEAEKYLAEYRNHFWCDFDSSINDDFEEGASYLTDAKLQTIESYAQNKLVDDHRKFIYGVIVFEGQMILTVNPFCKSSCPLLKVDLKKFLDPHKVVPAVNKVLMMAELARKQMLGEEFSLIEMAN
ncbi:hypothetical protein BN7_4033 [Wickerhamomyces ciferrii]|uniref:Uncharacterized protein n=1 Tax=Wickerhamomyces ciferrii (strain ATCC 14091 / BCRC 22168 / CBS 111 / JCM 3599 / NBRC 0793 / NRRL Y-1031 F-60-10) TaxID=1206466 RepID=K0KSW4_WICCF|nr:uncharacterized protein BN7_4033 [Wickerhamomyces ciferrii]CCH44469.1 hypothetical protein BN7_4033 [Wickerhamomyces ciferrii]